VNPLEGVVKFFISPYSLHLFKHLKITPEVIAESGTLGSIGCFPVVYLPIDYLFKEVTDCSVYSSGDAHWHITHRNSNNTIVTIYCKIVGDTMKVTTILYKKLYWPSRMTLEEADQIKLRH
jgi:hypothetical protein